MRRVAENEINSLALRQRNHFATNREMDQPLANAVSLRILHRKANGFIVGIQQVNRFGPFESRYNGEKPRARAEVNYGLAA